MTGAAVDSRISALIKPTLKTKFRIDFEWWKSQDHNWKVYLQSFLCPEHQKLLADYSYSDQIDLINPATGEVTRVDALLHTCLLYTSDAADDLLCVDLGGCRIIKKKTKNKYRTISNL